jgi:hypothetical protein
MANVGGDTMHSLCCCRVEAVRCLGLFSMLPSAADADAVASSQNLALLRTALASDCAGPVKEMAAQALCDMALVRWTYYG